MAKTKGAYKLTETKRAEILLYAEQGLDCHKIARKTGVSEASVRNVCKAGGVVLTKKRRRVRRPRLSHQPTSIGKGTIDQALKLISAHETGFITSDTLAIALASVFNKQPRGGRP